MADAREPKKVRLLTGVLAANEALRAMARALVEEEFGPVMSESETVPFDYTDYYRRELGATPVRFYVVFEREIMPDEIVSVKHRTNDLEKKIGREYATASACRPVNVDPGYMDLSKLVLASMKHAPHRIYVGGGVNAEITLLYRFGGWQTLPWTYPDYADEFARAFYERARSMLLEQSRADRPPSATTKKNLA